MEGTQEKSTPSRETPLKSLKALPAFNPLATPAGLAWLKTCRRLKLSSLRKLRTRLIANIEDSGKTIGLQRQHQAGDGDREHEEIQRPVC